MVSRIVFKKLLFVVALIASSQVLADGSLNTSREVTLNAAPATVWKMIGDFNHLDVWHPVVVASDLNDKGDVRVLTLGDGAKITEKLVKHDDAGMMYTYTITESPLPVKDYVSTISVMPAEGNKTVVKWSSSFNAKGAEDAQAVATISGIYEAGLNNLAKHFSRF
jgi:mxaD protein